MLENNFKTEKIPHRVVVIGSGGFIGREIVKQLKLNNIPILTLSRIDVDFLEDGAGIKLTKFLVPNDVLIFAAAIAPCTNLISFQKNIKMINELCTFLEKCPVSHLIYLSSDAVYKDSKTPIVESSCAEPSSLHGAMHLTREIALRQSYVGPLTIVRPTLVYGLEDTHNGYGPNKFRRLASKGDPIVLFGQGEELRDHVDVEDVAILISKIIMFRSCGIVNAVSGEVVSFRKIAEFIANEFNPKVLVKGSIRLTEMPHGGYRAFDNSNLMSAFPGFKFKSWRDGLSQLHKKFISQSRLDSCDEL